MNEYIIALLKCKGIGNVKLLNYINKYKKNIVEIKKNLKELISPEDFNNFELYLKQAVNEINTNKKNNIDIITLFNNNYPNKLLLIDDPILYLYYVGNIDLINNSSIAIIGSRKITKDDEKCTYEISKKFASNGITVVSGLALGTDTYAHLASYNCSGSTIAVLPSGLDKVVPLSNENLAKRIIDSNGLLVSEYSIGTAPTKYSFVKRDRIQAALSDAVIVIKANEKSGTMNAVKVAKKSNKFVCQLLNNNNSLIQHSFSCTDEDYNQIINIIKSKNYDIESTNVFEQESLF